jgi:hypothetical protein
MNKLEQMHVEMPKNGFGFSNILKPDTTTVYKNKYSHGDPFPVARYEEERNLTKLFDKTYIEYNLNPKTSINDEYIYANIFKNVEERNNVMDIFFSRININHLHDLINNMIFYITKIKISNQDEKQLLGVMYFKYIGAPLNGFAEGQELKHAICSLNKDVLDYIVPQIFTGMKQYISYMFIFMKCQNTLAKTAKKSQLVLINISYKP